jgi:hypothetical protein
MTFSSAALWFFSSSNLPHADCHPIPSIIMKAYRWQSAQHFNSGADFNPAENLSFSQRNQLSN